MLAKAVPRSLLGSKSSSLQTSSIDVSAQTVPFLSQITILLVVLVVLLDFSLHKVCLIQDRGLSSFGQSI